MFKIETAPYYSYKMLSRFLIVTTLAAIGVILGTAPKIDLDRYSLSFQSAAYAEDFGNDKLERYARAARQIEQKRLRVYNRISSSTGSAPSFTCYQQASFNSLSQQTISVAKQFCDESRQIVRKNGLTLEEFNRITIRRKTDSNLNRRIEKLINEI